MRRMLPGLLGVVGASFLVAMFWVSAPMHPPTYVSHFPTPDHVSRLVAAGDTQADVTLARGIPFGETGYRWRRPANIVLAWVGGLGHPGWMPYGLMVLSILGIGFLCFEVGEWAGPIGALVAFFLGSVAAVHWFSLEPIGLALALRGWRTRNPWLLAAAGLFHETFLIFALHRRKWWALAPYGVWAAITVLLWGAHSPAGTIKPFGVGVVYEPTAARIAFLLTLGLGLVALTDRTFRWLAAMFLALALVLGPAAWDYWMNFTRILLPLWVLGFLAVHHYATSSNVSAAPDRSGDVDLDRSLAARAPISHG